MEPDERLCPYCAASLEAGATRCGSCGSEVESGPARESDRVPRYSAADYPEVDVEPPSRARAGRLILLTTAVVVLAGVLALLVVLSRPDALRTAANHQVTSPSYRDTALSAAASDVTTFLSYDYRTIQADQQAALAVATGPLVEEYRSVMDRTAAKVRRNKLSLAATVVGTGMVSLTEFSASVLLFVDTSTRRAGSEQPELNQIWVVATLTRKDGAWLLTKVDTV